ncbi:MAG TPA: glucose-6-phosphate isomerase [Acidimicrobiia bacterium]|nr:glucose-6-phosphate isomerase [Acidimicrobiia bacterium]
MSDPAWDTLVLHAESMRERTVRQLFADEPHRDRMHVEAAGWYLDFAKHRVGAETLRLLRDLVVVRGLRERIDAMFRGDHVNVTEDRPVLHVALRRPADAPPLVVDGVDVGAEVQRVLHRMSEFAESIRDGSRVGHTGRVIRNVVNIGIGGSDLGPAMAYDALRAYSRRDMQFRFVSNVDGADLVEALYGLDAAETMFVVSSKTFTTAETLTNAGAARAWLLAALGGDDAAVARHFVAVSTNAVKVAEFGIDTANMFEFWDWVGGRYSMWSAIGLSLMLAIGPDQFRELLAGAHEMDEHFRTAPFDANLPVLMGLLTCWYRDFLDAQSQAVVPYANALVKLPSYLQQLEMESNGKSVRTDGSPVDAPTGEIVWGTVGTNGQHAYFQLLHQGTSLVPIDFIGFDRPQPGLELGDQQHLLVANMLAQAEALAFGTDDPALPAYRVMPGNRPSSVLTALQLTPFALGALVAAYEHKVMTLGTIWGIDSYDQWGVELGKALAQKIAAEIAAPTDPVMTHDPSTSALIRRHRERSS